MIIIRVGSHLVFLRVESRNLHAYILVFAPSTGPSPTMI
jgi:hypothetical protein